MSLNRIIVLLLVLFLVILGVLGYLLSTLNSQSKIKVVSQIPGVKLVVNNEQGLGYLLRDSGFWTRTDWERYIHATVSSQPVNGLTVILTDKYLEITDKEGEEVLDRSATFSILNGGAIFTVQAPLNVEGEKYIQEQLVGYLFGYLQEMTKEKTQKLIPYIKGGNLFRIVK